MEPRELKGFFKRLLRIDLGEKSFRYEELSDQTLRQTLGGKGLGTRLLSQENPVGVEPLAPEARLILTVGPVTGTRIWGQSRYGMYAKSPATEGFAESYCGGHLPARIKGCGVDALIVQGRAEALIWLAVDEEGVRFHDAAEIRGRDTVVSTEYLLQHSQPGAGAMVIGPAGENRVSLACVKSDRWRSCGRTGMGAVFGSKNLKGISFAGSQRPDYYDPELLREVIRDIGQKGKENPSTEAYQKMGTPLMVALGNRFKSFPTRYWQKGYCDAWHSLSADYMLANFEVKSSPCDTCFLRCTKHTRVLRGRHAGLEIEGPEYETIYALGGLNELDSLEEVAFLNDLCDRLGLDTISSGNLSGFAIESFKRGKTDFAIDYNQPDRMAELVSLIAHRSGIGDLLARGIREAAAELGLEDLAVHVKGLEPAGFDPRVLKGMGLSYATAARGACHLRGTFYKAEFSGQIDPDQIEGKARLHIDYEDRAALFDCLILCRFFRDIILWEELGRIVTATTGLAWSREQLERFANTVTQATRAYNRREGVDESQDTLPRRLLEEPTAEGASLSRTQLEAMVADYDRIRADRQRQI